MSERVSKFFGLAVFIVLMIGFGYLMITGSKASPKEVYNQIEIIDNKLLPAKEYLLYAGLNDSTKYENLTLLEVKTRIEKHPYLRKAEVEFDGVNKILVEVKEKQLKAVLLQKNELRLITSDLETLPLFPPSAIKDLPVISSLNSNGKNNLDVKDIEFAFSIIDAISLCDTNIRNKLAEINLRKAGDAVLIFAGIKYPFLFGKGDEIRKTLILKQLWQQLTLNENPFEKIDYIDLRYKNKVFIGSRKTELVSR